MDWLDIIGLHWYAQIIYMMGGGILMLFACVKGMTNNRST